MTSHLPGPISTCRKAVELHDIHPDGPAWEHVLQEVSHNSQTLLTRLKKKLLAQTLEHCAGGVLAKPLPTEQDKHSESEEPEQLRQEESQGRHVIFVLF